MRILPVSRATVAHFVGRWCVATAAILCAALAVTSLRCGPGTHVLPRGTVRVALEACREPQVAWWRAELVTLGVAGPTWVETLGEADVTVACDDTGPTGGAEEYARGGAVVRVDPSKANGEFAFRAAVGHGLLHWLADHGPHPERTTTHVCWYPYNVPPPPGCHATIVARDALMAPTLGAGGGVLEWSSTEVYTGPLAQYDPTDDDLRWVEWATAP